MGGRNNLALLHARRWTRLGRADEPHRERNALSRAQLGRRRTVVPHHLADGRALVAHDHPPFGPG
jgi:hypothetical protein